ncbi:GHMP family kinase ATP-binding protein, partial [Halarchaeum acidiphilum]
MADTGTVTVSTGARLHFGFANLSPAHERLYGSVGVALEDPRVTVSASRASSISCPDELDSHVRRAVARLDVPGAHVAAVETLPRHVGLGSGTATALAVFAAVARAYGRDPG